MLKVSITWYLNINDESLLKTLEPLQLAATLEISFTHKQLLILGGHYITTSAIHHCSAGRKFLISLDSCH